MIAIRLFGLSSALCCAVACGCDASADATNAAPAPILRETADLPARYAAALPTMVEAFDDWREGGARWPPMAHVRDRLLAGDAGMLQRLEAAATRVPAGDAEAWAEAWSDMLEYQIESPAFCAAVRPHMAADDSTLRRALAAAFAGGCADEADAALMLRADTPDRAVFAYYDGVGWMGVKRAYSPRLAEAARRAILHGEGHDARSAAFQLVDVGDPRGVDALLEIHAAIADQARADEVALAFLRSDRAEGVQRARAACVRRPQDPMCANARAFVPVADDGEGPARVSAEAVGRRIAQLRAVGFDRVAALDPAKQAGDDAETLLQEAGYAYWFDTETGMYPNEHDSLMRALAERVSPALDDAVFEEIPPAADAEDAPYLLRAYVGGQRYSVRADNLGDWYDVSAVLRLMNRVLSDLGREERLVVLASGGQDVVVVGAPQSVLDAAFAQGVLRSGAPMEAIESGKAFEREVRDAVSGR